MFDIQKDKASMKLTGVLLGLSISILLLLLGLVIVSFIINFVNISSLTTDKIMSIINYSVVFIGGLIAAYTSKNKGWLNGGLVGLIYIVILIILGSFMTTLVFSGSLLLKILTVCLISALGGIIGINMV
ncbi:TIGR04086 family membrane protein [Halanaerobacter jeridensis]|uniref:Membrane protein (TIGR04086 family) n=1 Tax=Halanaerobacter jeridensis TaxID=706427 RepID=A0A939BS18_9FIRM|nr:TIGR04086 family membrane protein [Halanaerobacter jeridensis]MBM7557904.1 putative membrane protein (TIGR04086 family) [Halanaerobacter jeridensis]